MGNANRALTTAFQASHHTVVNVTDKITVLAHQGGAADRSERTLHPQAGS